MNIKYILTHPIQYQSPLIKFLYKNKIKIKVLYRSNMSANKYFDPEFKKKLAGVLICYKDININFLTILVRIKLALYFQ